MITRIASIYLALVFLSLDCQATIMYLIQPDQLLHYQPEVPVQGPLTVETSSRMVQEGIPVSAAGKPKTDKEEETEFVNLIFDSGQEIHLGFSLNDPINSSYNDFFVFEAAGDVLKEGKAASFSFQYAGATNAPSYLILNGETIYDLDLSQHVEGTKVEVQIAANKLLKGENKIGIHSADLSPISFSDLEIEWAVVAQNQLLNESERKENHKLLAAVDSFGTESIIGRLLPKGAYPSIPKGLQNAMPKAVALNVKQEDIGASQSFEFRLDATVLVSKKKDLRLFYFDQQSLNWVDFRPDTIFLREDLLVLAAPLPIAGSYFAGFKSTPAGSEGSITLPTNLMELSAPSPFEGFGRIPSPTINQKGTAETAFPLNLPPGRNNLAPILAISYNSDSKGGLLGEGWDLHSSSIDVDLRWGVPRFMSNVESEAYTLDGSILSMEGGFRGNRRDASGNYANRVSQPVLFFPKSKGEWQEIKRYGTDPLSYFWIVTTADQTKMYFGTSDGVGVDQDAVVTNDEGEILSWKLRKLVDKWGNYIEYSYQEFLASSSNDMLNQSKQTLLTRIRYTGYSSGGHGIAPPYLIEFNYGTTYRKDARVSYRTGVKRGDFKLLDAIIVSYDPDPSLSGDEQEIRRYEFEKDKGDFDKTILRKIKEIVNSQVFYEFEFEYFKNTIDFESTAIEIPSPWDDNPEEYSMLGATDNGGFSIGGVEGLGVIASEKYYNSIYGGASFGRSYNYGRSSLQDLNGDGLLDYVIQEKGWSALKYFPGRLTSSGIPYFGNEKVTSNSASGVSNNRFLYSMNNMHSLFIGAGLDRGIDKASGGYSWDWNINDVKTYTHDLNGDGITDVVEDHEVSFGKVDPNTHNVIYVETSETTPNPIYDDAVVNYPVEPGSNQQESEIVRSWRAMVDGSIDITSIILLNNSSSDGIEFAVEHLRSNNTINTLQAFSNLNPGSQTTLNINNIPVKAGERIFFRAVGKSNTRYDLLEWNPRIEYQSGSLENADQVLITNSTAEDGFLMSGIDQATVDEFSNVTIDFPDIYVPAQSDTVRFTVSLEGYVNENLTLNERFEYVLLPGVSQNISKTQFNWSTYSAFIGSGVDLSLFDQAYIRFQVSSPSNVNWKNLNWRPEVINTLSSGLKDYKVVPVVHYKIFERALKVKPPLDLQHTLPEGGGRLKFEVNADPMLETDYYNQVNHSDPKSFVVKIKTEHDLVQTIMVKLDPAIPGLEIVDLHHNQELGQCGLDQSLEAENDFTAYKAYVSAISDDPILAGLIDAYVSVNLLEVTPNGNGYTCQLISTSDFLSIYYTDGYGIFGPEYLGWGCFGWNGEVDQIDPAKLTFGTSSNGQGMSNSLLDTLSMGNLITTARLFALDPDLQVNPFRVLKPERGEYQSLSYFSSLGNLESDQQDAFVHPYNNYSRLLSKKRSLGRIGEIPTENIVDFIDPGTSDFDKTAPYYRTRGYNTSYSVGGSLAIDFGLPFTLGVGKGYSSNIDTEDNDKGNHLLNSLMDFNGDGYPDELMVNRDLNRIEARLTDAQGGRRNLTTVSNGGAIWRNRFDAQGQNLDITGSEIQSFPSGPKSTLVLGLGTAWMDGFSNFEVGLVDINGDGLPDMVDQSSGINTVFHLNNGESILNGTSNTSSENINNFHVEAKTNSYAASIGNELFSKDLNGESEGGNIGVSGSLTYARTLQNQETTSMFKDVNADGLLDVIEETMDGYKVYLNNGTDFGTSSVGWTGNKVENISETDLGKVDGVIQISLSKIVKSLRGGNASGFFADTYQKSSLVDVNGDGYVDLVTVDENNTLLVYLSKVKKSNLLKRILSPTGSIIDLDYERLGHKYGMFDRSLRNYQAEPASEEGKVYWDMNYSKWVLTEVRLQDGFLHYPNSNLDDGSDEIVNYFHYDGGVHDRRNREFLGFSRIGVESEKYINLPNVEGHSWFNTEINSNRMTKSLIKDANELYHIQIQQFPEPLGSDFSERIMHSYIAGLVQETYNILIIKERQPDESYVPRNYMIEHQRFSYDYHRWVNNNSEEGLPINTIDLEDSNFEFVAIGESECLFPELISSETFSFLNYDSIASTQQFLASKIDFTYNRLGLITRAIYNGSNGPGQVTWDVIGTNDEGNIIERKYTPAYKVDLIALMNYYSPQLAGNRVGQIERYRLYSGDTLDVNSLLRRFKVDQLTTDGLAVRKVGEDNGNSSYSYQTFHYLNTGQIDFIELPPNHKGDRKELHFKYEGQFSLFPTSSTQRFLLNDGSQWDETTHMVIDPATALLHKTVDINGQPTEIYYDQFYRLERIYGPREIVQTNTPYTVAFEYWSGDLSQETPWSMIKQYLGTNAPSSLLGANPISSTLDLSLSAENRNVSSLEPVWSSDSIRRTASITDGWGRVIQTQQEVSILGGQNTNLKGRRISGPVAYDNFANAISTHGAIATNLNASQSDLYTLQVTEFEAREPVYLSHIDAFGRPALSYVLSDFTNDSERIYTKSDLKYNWGTLPEESGTYAYQQIRTWGHELKQEQIYLDYFGYTKALIQGTTQPSVTRYAHNAIGELEQVINPAGLTTDYQYDLRGRIVQEDHADRGTIQVVYDLVGNVTQSAKSSSNAQGEIGSFVLNYSYEYNRLLTKSYPESDRINNLAVTYGRPGENANVVGRVKTVKQGEAGAYVLQEKFRYNRLGQISREDRTIAVPQYGEQRLVSDFVFDSWGRLKHMRYPDGERLTYHYSGGGDLEQIETTASFMSSEVPSFYMEEIQYDGFGQPLNKRFGNGVESSFTYDDLSGSLTTYELHSSSNNGLFLAQQVLDKEFSYDASGNISKVQNHQGAMSLPYNTLGGSYTFDYSYDELNQLEAAVGSWQGSGGQSWNYNLNFTYDSNGRVLTKSQSVTDAASNQHPNADYNFTYNYSDPNRNGVTDISSPTNNYLFQYDAFGNLNAIQKNGNTDLEHIYDEEHRLRGSASEFEVQHNIYDPYGIRMMKGELQKTELYENGELIGNELSLQPYIVNAGPHYLFQVFDQQARVSKHYYGVGGNRVASRVLSENLVPEGYSPPEPGQEPNENQGSGGFFGDFNPDDPGHFMSFSSPNANNVVLTQGLATLLTDFAKTDWYLSSFETDRLEFPIQSYDRDACAWELFIPEGEGGPPVSSIISEFQQEFCDCISDPVAANAAGTDCDLFPEIYWYHGDGLGNIEYLTDLAGMPYEYFWYAPTGELIEHQQQGNAAYNTPFQFSARTYDVLTDLVYMGARFYSPQFSVFTSVDPMYAYRSWISPYNYVQNNPVMREDPSGMLDNQVTGDGEPPNEKKPVIYWNGYKYYIVKDGVKYYWSELLRAYISTNQETIFSTEPPILDEVIVYAPAPTQSQSLIEPTDVVDYKPEPHYIEWGEDHSGWIQSASQSRREQAPVQAFAEDLSAFVLNGLSPLGPLDQLIVVASEEESSTTDIITASVDFGTSIPGRGRAPRAKAPTPRSPSVRAPRPGINLSSSATFNRGSRIFRLEQGNASSGWKHIYDRHINPSRFPKKTKFDSNLSESDIKGLLNKTLKHGKESSFEGLSVFTYRTKINGRYRKYRATVNTDGTVRTFHPLE